MTERHANWKRVQHYLILDYCHNCCLHRDLLTTDCSKKVVSPEQENRISTGKLDYVAGEWFEK